MDLSISRSWAQQDAIGVEFVFTVADNGVPVDLTNVVLGTLKAFFEKPDKTVLEKTGTLVSAVKGQFKYVTIAGDLDQAGSWEVQADFILGNFRGRTKKAQFKVLSNVPD